MELLITIAYAFLVRLVFFDYKLLRFSLFWKFMVYGIWSGAVLTEVILLGQFAPYSKDAFVQAYVVQMAPEYGGLVNQVFVKANVPVKKGDPLFQMDPAPWQYKVDGYAAQLAAADATVSELAQQVDEADAEVARVRSNLEIEKTKYLQIAAAAAQSAASQFRLEGAQQQVSSLEAELLAAEAARRSANIALESNIGEKPTVVAEALAELKHAQYTLEKTMVLAPSDGYVSNMQLHAGGFVRLKAPVMTFVSSEAHWIIAKTQQQGIQHVAPGDSTDIAFSMYPGRVFTGVVESVAWANGNTQGVPGGLLPTESEIQPPTEFFVRVRLTDENPDYPLRFGAAGSVAIYPRICPDFLKFLRQIEIQSESYMNYLFNPF